MFGEAESESPRTGSPWDGLLSSGTTSPASRDVAHTPKDGICAVPKLVPEVEEGNVEYKLQLLSPTPARFAKLVTQLKWRLLEGGGQALYEVGVADSGQLVGLCRRDLESSLETLEEMAGEIGASVIVVKEIEVPRTRRIGIRGMKTDGAMRMSKLRLLSPDMGSPPTMSIEELEDTSSSETETTDDEELFSNMLELPFSLDDDTVPGGGFAHRNHRYHRADPSRPSAQSSPLVAPVIEEDDSIFTLDLEIASVYKPRPMRKRSATSVLPTNTLTVNSAPVNDNFGMCLDLGAEMEALSLANRPEPVKPSSTQLNSLVVVGNDPNSDVERKMEKKAKKRDRRNANRERRRLHPSPFHPNSVNIEQEAADADFDGLTEELLAPVPVAAAIASGIHSLIPSSESPFFHSPSPGVFTLEDDDSKQDLTEVSDDIGDKLYIVEALVVRKMSVDEAFLDFEGFSILEL